jgi:hypothetical protein
MKLAAAVNALCIDYGKMPHEVLAAGPEDLSLALYVREKAHALKEAQ